MTAKDNQPRTLEPTPDAVESNIEQKPSAMVNKNGGIIIDFASSKLSTTTGEISRVPATRTTGDL